MSETLSTTEETAKTLGGVTVFGNRVSWIAIIAVVVLIAGAIYLTTKKTQTL